MVNYCFISYSDMFDRFRQKYPQGSITSSLIQIHNDRYIVSVSIKVDGVILATTLAADEQIQVAEALATAQALQTLSMPEPLVHKNPTSPVQPIAMSPTMTELPLTRQPRLEPEMVLSNTSVASATIEPSLAMPLLELVSPTEAADLEVAVEPEPQPTNSHKKAAIVQEDVAATNYHVATDGQPLSVTDMIPLINMELKRLAWSREKGRDCIIELYNKRSSSLLSDEELLGLLRYLQAQTAPD